MSGCYTFDDKPHWLFRCSLHAHHNVLLVTATLKMVHCSFQDSTIIGSQWFLSRFLLHVTSDKFSFPLLQFIIRDINLLLSRFPVNPLCAKAASIVKSAVRLKRIELLVSGSCDITSQESACIITHLNTMPMFTC